MHLYYSKVVSHLPVLTDNCGSNNDILSIAYIFDVFENEIFNFYLIWLH